MSGIHGGIGGSAELTTGEGGLPLLRVRNDHAECDIYLYGAHVARFKRPGSEDLLWMSPTSPFVHGKAIRGGIPVCFPWFGLHRTRSDLPQHGFARIRLWELESVASLDDGRTRITLRTADDERTREMWPHRFGAELAVTVGATLDLSLLVENRGEEPFRYEDCFHTYFRVGRTYDCAVEGLDGVGYIDRARGDARGVQSGAVRPAAEIVNAYMRAPSACALADGRLKRRISIAHAGFSSTVVWNPGEAAAAKNPEIGSAWDSFLCVESANCLDGPVLLLPGTAHRSAARFAVEDQG